MSTTGGAPPAADPFFFLADEDEDEEELKGEEEEEEEEEEREQPGTHSFGKTALSANVSGDGLAANLLANRIETSERASRRETTVVFVRKMEREMRSAREGRHGEDSSGGSISRARRRR